MTTPLPADVRLTRARSLARLLDDSIRVPGTNFRFGLDPLLGLVPGLGDLAGAVLSAYIVLVGIRLGASRSVVLRMFANVAIDTLVGSLPVLGDLFDAGWKSNDRNVALIERHLDDPAATRASSRLMIAAGLAVLSLLGAAGAVLTVLVLRWLIGLMHP